MGKSIISIAIFNSKLLVYQMVYPINIPLNHYKILVNHYKVLLNHYNIPLNPFKIPLNHYKSH